MTKPFESVDVLIVGAGLAGIGGACQLRRNCSDRSFMILESRATSGGTWDLFRYPGIRSDSDMYTYSYGFKPWRDKSTIADGQKILDYIREAAGKMTWSAISAISTRWWLPTGRRPKNAGW